jgi:hypothetical protein
MRSAMMWDPHSAQNQRSLPGDDSKDLRTGSPRVQRKRSRGTVATLDIAAPCALRQVRQWQWAMPSTTASAW